MGKENRRKRQGARKAWRSGVNAGVFGTATLKGNLYGRGEKMSRKNKGDRCPWRWKGNTSNETKLIAARKTELGGKKEGKHESEKRGEGGKSDREKKATTCEGRNREREKKGDVQVVEKGKSKGDQGQEKKKRKEN